MLCMPLSYFLSGTRAMALNHIFKSPSPNPPALWWLRFYPTSELCIRDSLAIWSSGSRKGDPRSHRLTERLDLSPDVVLVDQAIQHPRISRPRLHALGGTQHCAQQSAPRYVLATSIGRAEQRLLGVVAILSTHSKKEAARYHTTVVSWWNGCLGPHLGRVVEQ